MTDKVTVECSRGFGIVKHPESGEPINVEESFTTTRETFEVLDEAYPGFRIVAEDAEPEESGDPECGVNGCGRSVGGPEETCWQHSEG